jgi:eukaryotic-like serine/threonine-protein kinase
MLRVLSAGDLLCAVLALRLQYLQPRELAEIISGAEFDERVTSASLESMLLERGVLTPQRARLLDELRKSHLERNGGDLLRCLTELGLAGGSPASGSGGVAELTESLAKLALAADAGPAPPASPQGNAAPKDPPRISPPTLPLIAGDSTADGDSRPPNAAGPPNAGLLSVDLAPSRFRKLRTHAKGGLGKISIAEDEQLRRKVALKEILEKHADSPENRARFIREAEITGALEHPGIVPVYALGHFADGRPYYAMRLIRGASLQAAVERLHGTGASSGDRATTELAASPEDGPSATLEPAETNQASEAAAAAAALTPSQRRGELRRLLRRFLVVCETIHYAHSRGVIHRDLKPSNIMLGRHGETLVVDWGLAKTLEHAEFQVDDSAGDYGPLALAGDGSDATLAGRVIGTPGFMAPEQAEGDLDRLTPATDIYSLGATLYCLLTGRPPFQAATAAESIEQIRRGEFPRPRAVNSAVSPALEAVCMKAMATQPRDRYASAKELADELDLWLADEPVLAWREPLWRRGARWMRRHRSWTAAGAAALVLITIVSAASAVWVGAARRSEAFHRKAAEQQGELAEKQREVAEQQRKAAEKQKEVAEQQRKVAERLAAAMLVKDVEALRRDRPPGWTWTGMKQLSQAMNIAPEELDLPQVRTLAAACLTSVDARPSGDYGRRQPSHCVAFSPDGRLLADAASKSGWTSPTVTLATPEDGANHLLTYPRDTVWEWRTTEWKPDGGRALAFSPDGRWLVVGTRSGWIYRWDLRQLDLAPEGWKPQEDGVEVHELLFSRDGSSLYAVARTLNEEGAPVGSTITRWTTDWPAGPRPSPR